MAKQDDIARAHQIAVELERDGYSGVDGSVILAMALGILMEGQEGGHRNLRVLSEAMLEAAQVGFDALREGRNREPGHA